MCAVASPEERLLISQFGRSRIPKHLWETNMQKTPLPFVFAVLVSLSSSALRVLADDIKVWPFLYQNSDPETQTARTELMWRSNQLLTIECFKAGPPSAIL